MATGKERYNAGSDICHVVLKTEVPNTLETLHCEDQILPGCEGYENQI
jgi:hypothetical protein